MVVLAVAAWHRDVPALQERGLAAVPRKVIVISTKTAVRATPILNRYRPGLIVAPRFYPSTKKCSACGHIKAEMPLGERVFQCEVCGAEIDRNLNAARNLASLVAGSSPETQDACEAESSGYENDLVKPAAAKQEPLSRKLVAVATGNKRL